MIIDEVKKSFENHEGDELVIELKKAMRVKEMKIDTLSKDIDYLLRGLESKNGRVVVLKHPSQFFMLTAQGISIEKTSAQPSASKSYTTISPNYSTPSFYSAYSRRNSGMFHLKNDPASWEIICKNKDKFAALMTKEKAALFMNLMERAELIIPSNVIEKPKLHKSIWVYNTKNRDFSSTVVTKMWLTFESPMYSYPVSGMSRGELNEHPLYVYYLFSNEEGRTYHLPYPNAGFLRDVLLIEQTHDEIINLLQAAIEDTNAEIKNIEIYQDDIDHKFAEYLYLGRHLEEDR